MQQLGLSISRYLPEARALLSYKWRDAFDWQPFRRFTDLWQSHVFEPLRTAAARRGRRTELQVWGSGLGLREDYTPTRRKAFWDDASVPVCAGLCIAACLAISFRI